MKTKEVESKQELNSKLPLRRLLRSIAVATLVSVLISDLLYFFATLLDPSLVMVEGYIISTLIPLVVAPVISAFIAKSKYRLEVMMGKLKVARDRAEASVRSKNSFLANMSHEIRTPLTHILGFSELLLEDLSDNLTEQQREYLTYILGSSRKLLAIINEVLDFARIEAGKIEIRREEIDIDNLLAGILKVFERDISAKGIKIDTKVEKLPARLFVDREKFERVIYNLLSNSLKFTPNNGKIRIRVYSTYIAGEPKFHFEIADNGIGIASENLQRIFESFEQVEEENAREYHGIGLGLAISKKLIEQHGGKIWAESAGSGEGSTFHIVLPLEKTG